MQPNYAPNTVNQTVDFGGFTWKGNPGQGWVKQSATGGAPVSTGDPVADSAKYAQWAQAQQIAANAPAIETAKTAGASLDDQYKALLASVTASGSATYNTATSGENAYLGARGLLSQSGRGNTELSQAQNMVNTTNAVNAGQVTKEGAGVQSQIAQYIGGLQAGNVPQALNFGQNIGNTEAGIINTNTAQDVALQSAKLTAAKPFGVGNLVFNPTAQTGQQFVQPGKGGGGGGMDIMKLASLIASARKQTPTRPSMSNISQFVQ